MIDIVLLVLKIGILILLYLFIWQVVKTAVATVRAPAGAAAPDVALPEGSRPVAVFTPAEREARREDRLTERTIAGESLDFTGHIDPRLIVKEGFTVLPLEVPYRRVHAFGRVFGERFLRHTLPKVWNLR